MDQDDSVLSPGAGRRGGPRIWREHAALFLFYLLAVLALTWPLVTRITTEVLGHPRLSVKTHLWQYWWTREALFTPGWHLFQTPLLYYPKGLDTLRELGNFFLPLVSLPFQFLLGLVGGFNATFILMMSVTGLATYALCRRFVASRPACLLGGLAVVALPYSWVEVYNGVPEIAILFWIPVCLLALDVCLDRPSAGRGALLGLILFLAAMSSWYYGFFLTLAVPLGFLVRGIAVARIDRSALRPLVVALLVTLAVHGSLILPFALRLRQASRVTADWEEWTDSPLVGSKANPQVNEFFWPRRFPLVAETTAFGPDDFILFPFAVFPGFVVLSLGALGLLRRRSLSPALAAIGICFFLLALGPYLKLGGTTRFLPFRIPLPGFFLASLWPGFSAFVLHSYRAVVIPSVLLAVLAARGAEGLLLRLEGSRAYRGVFVLGAGVLLLGDAFNGSNLEFPLRRAPAVPAEVYGRIAADPEPGGVADLPLSEENQCSGEFMLAQTRHRRPIITGTSYTRYNLFEEDLLLRQLKEAQTGQSLPEPPRRDAPRSGDGLLTRAGYRFIVLHRDMLPTAVAARMDTLIRDYAAPLWEDRSKRLAVYRITRRTEP